MAPTESPSPPEELFGPPAPDFSVRIDHAAGTVLLHGELDDETACLLAGVVDGQAARGRVRLTVDLTRLSFVDLRGFDALIDADERLRAAGGGLLIVGYDDIVACIARVCGAEGLLAR